MKNILLFICSLIIVCSFVSLSIYYDTVSTAHSSPSTESNNVLNKSRQEIEKTIIQYFQYSANSEISEIRKLISPTPESYFTSFNKELVKMKTVNKRSQSPEEIQIGKALIKEAKESSIKFLVVDFPEEIRLEKLKFQEITGVKIKENGARANVKLESDLNPNLNLIITLYLQKESDGWRIFEMEYADLQKGFPD